VRESILMRTTLSVAALLAGAALTLGACEQPNDYDTAANDTAAMPADNTMMDTNALNDDMTTNDMVTNDMTTNDVTTNDAADTTY